MRIVGGDFRGKALVAPEGRDVVRPTSDRTRENVFNVLTHGLFGSLIGAKVGDLFAGTGALGLEALSRGAASVTFVERSGPALAALKQNIQAMKAEKKTRIIAADATALSPAAAAAEWDLVFMDPPYADDVLPRTLAALRAGRWLSKGALLVCETRFSTDLEAPEGFEIADERRYGKAKVTFLRLL